LFAGLAAVLVLAVPASIARTSLIGAYVVIVALAAVAIVAVGWTARRGRPLPSGAAPRTSTALARICMLAAVYVVAVTAIHGAA
jgi:hypothetical protein